jgi:hypothetical protein
LIGAVGAPLIAFVLGQLGVGVLAFVLAATVFGADGGPLVWVLWAVGAVAVLVFGAVAWAVYRVLRMAMESPDGRTQRMNAATVLFLGLTAGSATPYRVGAGLGHDDPTLLLVIGTGPLVASIAAGAGGWLSRRWAGRRWRPPLFALSSVAVGVAVTEALRALLSLLV